MEGTRHIGAPAWPILREACVALAEELEAHVAREDPVWVRAMACMERGPFTREIPTHKTQARQLQLLVRDLSVHEEQMLKDVDAALSAMMEELQQQLDEQDDRLIPFAEEEGAPLVCALLKETATVNRLASLYPATQRVFEELGINRRFEGSDELEEVVWRHGLNAQTVLEQLAQAIRAA